MPAVWKDIFRTGTYRDHTGEFHKFTSADVKSAYRNGRAMLRSSIPIAPAGVWEHDWTSVPEKLSAFLSRIGPDRDRRADEAKNAFGWAKDFKIKYEPDVKSGGGLKPVLYALLNAPDQRDLEQLEKTRYVSPRVDWGYRDALGRTWDGCSVTHIAATHSPVQIDQRPLMLGRPPSLKTLFLGAPMADDPKPDDKPKKDGEGKTDTSGGDTTARLKAICEMMDWPVSDAAKTPEDVLLIMESHAAKGGDDNDPNDPNGTLDGDGVSAAGGMNAAMLSALAPELRAAVELEMKKGQVAEAIDRNDLIKRYRDIEKTAAEAHVFGNETPTRLKKLEERLTRVNLSYTPEGEMKTNGVISELEALEFAVNAKTGGQNKVKSKRVRAIDLSGLGGNIPLAAPPQKPGDAGYEEAVKYETEKALARVTRK